MSNWTVSLFQDDANHDPQWSEEQVIDAKLDIGGVVIGRHEYDIMARTTVTVFEVLERAWAALDCALIDMKIEFGIDAETSKFLLLRIFGELGRNYLVFW